MKILNKEAIGELFQILGAMISQCSYELQEQRNNPLLAFSNEQFGVIYVTSITAIISRIITHPPLFSPPRGQCLLRLGAWSIQGLPQLAASP